LFVLVADILAAVADRFSLAQAFRDSKEVWGVGQQQVRNAWTCVGAFHLGLSLCTLVELWWWQRAEGRLVDRSDSPWEGMRRRPSHADRRQALRWECLREEYRAVAGAASTGEIPPAGRKSLLRMVAESRDYPGKRRTGLTGMKPRAGKVCRA